MDREISVFEGLYPDMTVFEQTGLKCLFNCIPGADDGKPLLLQIILQDLPRQLERHFKKLDEACPLGIRGLLYGQCLFKQEKSSSKMSKALFPANILIILIDHEKPLNLV